MGDSSLEILIIAYAFSPDKTVGALRTSYWFEELPKETSCTTSVITANIEAKGEHVFVVPDTKRAPKWHPIKDSGLSWKKDIIDFLNQSRIKKPDVVLISGSPFMHFSLTKVLKQKYGCKVILDYRDPFADNANFQISSFKIWIKRLFEKRFNRLADGLITVNSYCGDRISGFTTRVHEFIANGFDERIVPDVRVVESKKPVFAYTGKFYFESDTLLNAIHDLGFEMNYAGSDTIHEKYKQSVKHHGFVNYKQAVQLVADSDVGVIQTVGDDSIATTKIFDYIRCKRIILVISKENLFGKGIQDLLQDYPNVYWSKNSEEDIKGTIEKILNSSLEEVQPELVERFSRKYQMQKLVRFIEKLSQ